MGTGRAVGEGGCQIFRIATWVMPGRRAGLLANAKSSSVISWCRGPSHPGVGRRLVECYCLGLPMKSLGNHCRRTSGWC